jgi:ankyrin repeat protein
MVKIKNKVNYSEMEHFVNADWENGRSLLHLAVEQDDSTLVKQCIQFNADVNKIDNHGETALFYCKSLEMAKFLVENGIDVNIFNSEGETAVVYLYNWGNIDIIKYLAGITNLDLESGKQYSSILLERMIYRKEDNLSLFEIVISRTNNINRIDNCSNSYLLSAVRNNKYLDVIMMLAKSGIDLYLRDKNGKNFYDLSFQYVKKKIEKEFSDFMKYKDMPESQRQRKLKLEQLNIISN